MDKNEQMADSFVFYGSIADTAEAIRKTYGIEKAWKYLYAIFDYGRFGLVPTEDDDELYATGLASLNLLMNVTTKPLTMVNGEAARKKI